MDTTDTYAKRISALINDHPLDVDTEITIHGKAPSAASSEFLTNREQGDWAEHLVISSINASSTSYVAVPYGRSENLSAGDEGFEAYYAEYQTELNTIGKRPDVLVFRRSDVPSDGLFDYSDAEIVSKAVAAIEVRSSCFLSDKYSKFMEDRSQRAEKECIRLRDELFQEPYRSILYRKSTALFSLLESASTTTFRELDFRLTTWSSSPELVFISEHLKQIKDNITLLHKRDFLSITPKLEDIALVNRWIQIFNVPHYYLQVFFDRGYVISFEDILRISSNSELEGSVFTIERDVKNQGKTTIKIDIGQANPIIGKIEMPNHFSAMKELARGRLLFFVKFTGGQGFLDLDILNSILK